jgi:hypothetical protein
LPQRRRTSSPCASHLKEGGYLASPQPLHTSASRVTEF